MNAIQYISDEHGKTTSVIVPIKLWQEMTEDEAVIEPRTLTLSALDRDLFVAALESSPPANAALKALMSKQRV
jgi:hypothetical protein